MHHFSLATYKNIFFANKKTAFFFQNVDNCSAVFDDSGICIISALVSVERLFP